MPWAGGGGGKHPFHLPCPDWPSHWPSSSVLAAFHQAPRKGRFGKASWTIVLPRPFVPLSCLRLVGMSPLAPPPRYASEEERNPLL